ncbi:MAG: hypothetical protein HXX08_23990 [Chloroflexi bacterium]|uniref:ABM domain-containing protein n=1 Tax=Candidatus Chlorohelix allophototropha TaxID=3003348 RepID=A0A8T7MA36_9CHLR|nr:hypothetical protein [Chloroflexota bacterium]WJW68865.1 hypothetical protein OZ401_004484 [Chloroflexota bacterium L227-S17]
MSSTQLFLLTINGTQGQASLEQTRAIHNATAGAPANIATAQSLGDLSHSVFVPVQDEKGEFFIMDVWNDMEGLNQFFSNPHVQEQAGQIFATRDPVVWTPANDIFHYSLLAPAGKNERFLGVVRGTVSSKEQARKTMDAATSNGLSKARKLGAISHQNFFRMGGESLEFLGVEVWYSLEGAFAYYGDPAFGEQFHGMYTAEPASWILQRPEGTWSEW